MRNTNDLSNKILDNLKLAGQNTRGSYQRRLPSDPSKDYYFIHRNTGRTQPIIVEYGFLDSTSDDVKQLKNDYEMFAEAVVKAIANYTGVNYMPVDNNTYVVQRGDTLWSVAKKLGTTVNELKSINNLPNNALSIGQVLKIPGYNNEDDIIDNNTYVVKAGDTLYKIAQEFNISVPDLKAKNNLINDTLNIGQILTIPDSTQDITDNYINYTVKKGDNLYQIAKNYNTTQQEIMRLNNLTSNLLSIGQILQIPSKNTNTTYTVKTGDTLYKIAQTYNTTVSDLKAKNNLTNDSLSIGQILII